MVSYQELTVVLTMIMMKVSKSKVAVLVERVKELTITNLDVAHSPTTSNKRGQVASLLFRHLTLVEARYDLRFQEKTEVKLKYTSFIIVDFELLVGCVGERELQQPGEPGPVHGGGDRGRGEDC